MRIPSFSSREVVSSGGNVARPQTIVNAKRVSRVLLADRQTYGAFEHAVHVFLSTW
jgi:hypothetical protein